MHIISDEPLAVRAACYAQVTFDTPAPPQAELIIEHRCGGRLLARECRPVAAGARSLEIKTHPEASHVACSLHAGGGSSIDGVRFGADCGPPIEPTARNFIVIGAMKAGTTTLFERLTSHPAICRTWAHVPSVSFPKEVNYFNRLHRRGDTALHYDWRFPFDPSRHAWTLDVSPGYAKWPKSKGVPRRIRSLGGNTKLAYILREPIDRIESHLAHVLHVRGELANLRHCIRLSRYAMQLDKFTRRIDRDRILLLDFEQLRKDPDAVLALVCDFLGIERIAGHGMIHNRRGVDFHLDKGQRAELTEIIRPDVRRLIDVYGFRPAEGWLQNSS